MLHRGRDLELFFVKQENRGNFAPPFRVPPHGHDPSGTPRTRPLGNKIRIKLKFLVLSVHTIYFLCTLYKLHEIIRNEEIQNKWVDFKFCSKQEENNLLSFIVCNIIL